MAHWCRSTVTRALVVAAVATCGTHATAAWNTTQSSTPTPLGGGFEDFNSGGWTDPGIADVFSIIEENTIQFRIPADYDNRWTPDGADLELTSSVSPQSLFNIVGIEFVDEATAIHVEAHSSNGVFNGFGGGINVDMFLDGNFVGGTTIVEPNWVNNSFGEWVTISSDSGQTFDEIRFFVPFATSSRAALLDDVSWASVVTCACETDGDPGQVDVADLLAYLALWFAGDPGADLDGMNGTDVSDLLAFLGCWFPASGGAPCG